MYVQQLWKRITVPANTFVAYVVGPLSLSTQHALPSLHFVNLFQYFP